MTSSRRTFIAGLASLAAGLPGGAIADKPSPRGGRLLGPVTNLPLPRFVSISAGRANARRGPSLTHRIDWVFTRRGLPVEVTAEYGHWRRVRDHEGAGGWVHYALLSGVRTVLVIRDLAPMHARPDDKAPVRAYLEYGVIGRLGRCTSDWCRIRAGDVRGWVAKAHLWGVYPDEIRD